MRGAAGGWETWSWDESLFAGAAGYYEQGRLPYAPGLADVFARSLALDGRGRLLDVGCGPGTVTLRLAPLFDAAVGLDPDPGMLAYASRAAAVQGVGNVTWVRQRAEALPAGLGSFRAVTFAASFHWMDRPRVAAAVATMLDPGGAAVQVDAPGYRASELEAAARQGSLPFPPPPDGALDRLRRQYLGHDRRAGQGIRNTSPSGEDQVFREAGFRPAQTVTVPDQRIIERTADDIAARVFSTSSTAPHLFGDRREDFERDMREILARASPSGRFSVRLRDNILRVWRLPALAARRVPGAPVERSGRRADRDVPAEVPKLSLEVRGLVRNLHDPVRGAVGDLAADGRGGWALHEFVRSPVPVVREEHAARWLEAVSHERPEGPEALGRDMRQPEPHENHVVAAVGLPGEHVSLDETYPLAADSGRGDGEHLRRCVHGRDVRRVAEQLPGPHAGPAGELQHASGWPERVKRGGDLIAAGEVQPLVQVIRGQRTIVGDLLIEETVIRFRIHSF